MYKVNIACPVCIKLILTVLQLLLLAVRGRLMLNDRGYERTVYVRPVRASS